MHQKPLTFRLSSALTKIVLASFLTCFSGFLFAMEKAPAPSQIPMESLVGIDGEPFSTRDVLGKGKATIVFYLSPECGACTEQTKAITSNMDQMQEVQFLFVTAYAPESTEAFLEDHNIGSYENIRLGYDVNLALQQHYQLKAVPSIYLYGANGKLQQEWTGYTSVEVLRAAVDGKINSNSTPEKDLRGITEKLEDCPVPTEGQLQGLCFQLANNTMDEDTGISKYLLTLQRISCVKYEDPEQIAKEKVRTMWNKNATRIKCNLNEYNLPNYNILKYAVNIPHGEFVRDLIKMYDADVNFIDPEDGKTALEFCYEEIKKLESEPNTGQAHINQVRKVCGYLEEAKKKKEAGL